MSTITVIKLRRGTAADWTARDPILADGEIGYETDTATYKIGNGEDEWSSLPYYPAIGSGVPTGGATGQFLAKTSGADYATAWTSAAAFTSGTITGLATLGVRDTDASHSLIFAAGSDLTANRTLTITTGDADRTLTISGSTTLGGGSHSGTDTGDQTITLTGDVTGGGTGTFAATIANGAVTFAKMQAVSANVLLGNDASGTAVEEIACTAAGRALIDDADASAQRTTLGLGTIATQDANNVTITGGTVSGITDLAVADGGTGASSAADARTNLGLVIGTHVQAYDAELAAIAGLSSGANMGIIFTGSGTAATFSLTAAALTVLDDSTVADMVNTLGGASSTGTGGLVRSASPTLTTPDIGTPSSGTLTNCSGLPLTGLGIAGGTEDTAPALLSDYAAVYDASAAANRKVLLCNVNAAFNLRRMFLVWDDFMSTAAPMGLGGSTSGAGAGISNSGTFAAANVVGVAALSTGTTTTGRSALTGFTLSVVFGTNVWHFEAFVGTDPIGDATNDYTIRFGFIDSASAESTDGHYFRQNYNVNSGKFQAVTRSNTTETATDTGVAFADFTLYKCEIDVSADGSSAVFKINGSTVATHSTGGGATMPTGTSRAAGYGFYIQKAAGTTARNLYVDYYMVYSPVARS